MALESASGGSVTINASPDVTFHVTEWSIDDGNRIAETTTSAAAYSTFLGTLQDISWSFSMPVDNANRPETGGLVPGAVVDLYFRFGSSTSYHRCQNTTVERVTPVNSNTGDVVRTTVTGRGGVLTRYGAAPS